MKKRFISIAICLCMVLSLLPAPIFAVNTSISSLSASEFAGGNGSAADPYLIETKAHLNNVRNDLDAHYKLIADIVFTDADFVADGEFYNKGSGWRPIGEYGIGAFSGVFDGNSHKITGLHINVISTGANAVGLFGLCKGAKIFDITLAEGEIAASAEKSTIYAGGIVGFFQESTIDNCANFCTVIAGDYMSRAGGIVGYATSESRIQNCKNYGAIAATDVSGNSYAGGIAGEVCSDAVVNACENLGNISSDYAAGGIAGDIFTRGQILHSHNVGEINANHYSGGIVGFSRSSILDCSNSGKVETASGGSCGGIVGYVNGGKVTTSYNTAEINTGKTASNTGGIAGASWHGSKIQQCFNSGKINGKSGNAGGIVGCLVYESSVEFAYNIGDVSSSGTKGAIAGYVMTGADAGIITNALYLDNISVGVGSGVDVATKSTEAQMQNASTYASWDFESVWEFKEKNLYLYPTLIENPYWDGEFAGGTGTEEDPYLIKTKTHLSNVRNSLDAHYKMVADIVFTDEDFAEGGLFYNNGTGWEPIGTFSGTFNGDGHTISNLYIKDTAASSDMDIGLFSISSGTIKNLGMVDTSISLSSFNACCGSVVGNNSGAIIACYNTGSVTSGRYTGGIAGYNSGTIINCYNSGKILGSAESADLCSGGIVGYSNGGIISQCYNMGLVSSTNSQYYSYAGGIVGYHRWRTVDYYIEGEINLCYNTGRVESTNMGGRSTAGGIAGYSDVAISDCYNTAEISATSDCGGIAGINDSSIKQSYNISLNCGWITDGGDGHTANCYYYSETSPNGCKLPSMYSQLTYTGFDFENVWQMGDGDYPFPVLRSVKNYAEFDFVLEENTTDFAGGKGIEADPFVIKTITHLNNIKNYPTSYFVIANDIAFDPESDNFPTGWKPFAFKGFLDGQGYKISNLRITVSNTLEYQWYNPGLFSLNDGIISNLTIDGSRISVSSMGDKYGGFICAENNGSIINCHSKDCTIALANIYHYFGGIAGNNTSIIRGCTSNNNIDWQSIGGRVGGIVSNNSGTIENCTNFTTIVNAGAYSPISGGIAAENSGTILLSQNLADISANATSDDSARSGGIVGRMTGGSISQCYNTGNISAEATQYNGYSVYVGGIVADITTGKISDCYSTGNVYGASESTSSSTYVGGIVGCNNTISDISNCYTIGMASGSARTSNLYIGYVCGNNASNSIINSYYLGIPENGTGSGDSTNMYGNVVTELKEMSTYNGFDFENTWTMEGNGDYPFPELISAPMVYENEIQSISIESMPAKLKYIQNYELLDVAGGTLKITYAYDEYDIIPLSDATLSGFDNSVVGMQSIAVSYLGSTTEFQIEIVAKSMEGIEVTTLPSKVTYFEGDAFSSAGMVVTACYNDKTSEAITGYAIDGYSATPGVKTIVISYGGKTDTFTITVNTKTITDISITQAPSKVSYVQGESLNTAGMVVKASYNNGTSADVTGYSVSGYDANKVGNQTITVTYGGKTATFTVTVTIRAPSTITSVKYVINNTYITKIEIGTTAASLKANLNEKAYIQITSNGSAVTDSAVIGTGMVVSIMDGATVKSSVTVVVTGDTNGDGKITVTDMIALKSHLLGKTKLEGAAAGAANTNGDGNISITDFIQIKAHILGKSTVVPN